MATLGKNPLIWLAL